MEQKKGILKAAKAYGQQDSYGNYTFILEFTNGDNGMFGTKQDQIGTMGFIIGQEVEYCIEKKVSKAGKDYYKITKPAAANNFRANAAANTAAKQDAYKEVQEKRLSFDEEKQILIIRQSTLKAAVDYHLAVGEMEHSKIIDTAEFFTNWVLTGKKPLSETDKLNHYHQEQLREVRSRGIGGDMAKEFNNSQMAEDDLPF